MTFLPAGAFRRSRLAVFWLLMAACAGALATGAQARSCVWKVTSGDHTLYLAGSVHALRSIDYPLPPAYDQAFRASSVVAFETIYGHESTGTLLSKAALLPEGTTIRDHLDPRVYDYILEVIANTHTTPDPEKKWEHLRPWAMAWLLHSPQGIDGVSVRNGVDSYIEHKAAQAHKPVVGLVPVDEHIAVFARMNDADSQAYLLFSFIALNRTDQRYLRTVREWKQGDIDGIDRDSREEFRDLPELKRRIITDRNRRWLPVIVKWLQSGQTHMVVAGTAHMAGAEGLPALLRAGGFQVEQL